MTADFDGNGHTWKRKPSVTDSEPSPIEQDDDAAATLPAVRHVGMGPDGSAEAR